jgi:glutamate-5-semialdehyde dehydrogenase
MSSEIVDINSYMTELGQRARAASRRLAAASTGDKNAALLAIAQDLEEQREQLMAENQRDD